MKVKRGGERIQKKVIYKMDRDATAVICNGGDMPSPPGMSTETWTHEGSGCSGELDGWMDGMGCVGTGAHDDT